jgi:hypothetical protein
MFHRSEKKANTKQLLKLRKTAIRTSNLLREVCKEDDTSRDPVSELHKRFSERREDVEGDIKTGRPLSMKTDENVEKVRILREHIMF